ncbi:MAG: PKD domain-containing protein, partial [Bacteroidota bacterium]
MLNRLELAGFQMSLATRLRVLRVLSGPGKAYLDNPKQLKFLICPVIARSPAEQERFYELFDHYAAELFAPLPEPPPVPVKTWWEKIPRLVWYGLLALSLLALAYVVYMVSQPVAKTPKAAFRHPENIRLGDTLHLANRSEHMHPHDYDFHWALLNEKAEKVEQQKKAYHAFFVLNPEEQEKQKTIRLTVRHKDGLDSVYVQESTVKVLCAAPPRIEQIEAPQQTKEETTIRFTAKMASTGDYFYKWDLGDGQKKEGISIEHRFDKPGNYTIRLNVEAQQVAGICHTVQDHSLVVGTSKAYLNQKTLLADPYDLAARFWLGSWLVFLLLLAFAFYNLWKWWKRPAPTRETAALSPEKLKEQFRSYDRAPYFIPFRSKNGQIRSERDLFRFADVLRQRQEGLRKFVDVPKTIQCTIEGGGFPHLQYRTRTQPSEYLFLIDEQSPRSHQSQLFRYLAELMKEKDIYAEIYWYKQSFHRFWNS